MSEILHNLAFGFGVALQPANLMYAVIGAFVGSLIGVLPGIGPVTGIALLIPLVIGINPATDNLPQVQRLLVMLDEVIARVNAELKAMMPELTASQWLSSTYINDDSQLLAAKANEKYLTALNGWIEQAKRFEGQQMSPETSRAMPSRSAMRSRPRRSGAWPR